MIKSGYYSANTNLDLEMVVFPITYTECILLYVLQKSTCSSIFVEIIGKILLTVCVNLAACPYWGGGEKFHTKFCPITYSSEYFEN